MEREVITFTDRNEICDIALGFNDAEWEVVSNDIVEQSRWATYHSVIVKRLSDGKFFITSYSHGSTEIQDSSPYEDDDMIFREVKPIEKTIITYEWKE